MMTARPQSEQPEPEADSDEAAMLAAALAMSMEQAQGGAGEGAAPAPAPAAAASQSQPWKADTGSHTISPDQLPDKAANVLAFGREMQRAWLLSMQPAGAVDAAGKKRKGSPLAGAETGMSLVKRQGFPSVPCCPKWGAKPRPIAFLFDGKCSSNEGQIVD